MPRSKRKSGASHATESNHRSFFRNITLTVCVLVFVVAIATGWFTEQHGQGMAGLLFVSFVLSQCSMVGTWAASWNVEFRGHTALTCAVVTLCSIVCWLTITGFRYVGFGDASEVCWAITICSQLLGTAIGATMLDNFSKTSRRRYRGQSLRGARLRRFSFDTGTLITWTTFAGIAFFAVHTIMVANGWEADLPTRFQAILAILLGLSGAVYAICWLAIFRGAVWSVVGQRLMIWLPLFLFSALFFHVVIGYDNSTNFANPIQTVTPLVGQYLFDGVMLLATLNHSRR